MCKQNVVDLFLIFIVSLELVNAKITVSIDLDKNINDIKIKCSGKDYKIVTDTEIHIFNITNEKLNKGMRIEMGKAPDSFFLKDPTYYGELYKKFKWEPVKRSLEVSNAKIIDVYNEDVHLTTYENINNSSLVVKYERNLHELVVNTAQSTWYVSGLPNDNIFYDLNLNFGYNKIKYGNKWRNDNLHATRMSIGVSKEGIIQIKPYETIITELYATQTIVLIELEHKAKLIGAIIANYAKTYGKYHFWAPSIQDIMKAAGMKNEIITKELIEIRCFLNPRLDVYNKVTGEVVEPPRKKQPLMKILKQKNTKRVLYLRTKKTQGEKSGNGTLND